MKKYEALGKQIIDLIGGEKNVKSLSHCVTRLRFKLKDEEISDKVALEKIKGIIGVIQSGGQYQIVIGNNVGDVYETIISISNINAAGEVQAEIAADENNKKESPFAKLLDLVSGIFSPILSLLAATGMIKGVTSLLLIIGVFTENNGTYMILNAIGDSLFYFFPIFLGKSAMKKFGGNETLGMILGAVLVYPSLIGIMGNEPLYTLFEGTMIESPVYLEFLGIPIIMMNYSSSVIPIIAGTALAAPIQKWFKNRLHNSVSNMLTPFLTLLIVAPLTFMVVGPIATWAGMLLGQLVFILYNISPIAAGLLLGGFWQVLVMFGLHWGIIPIGFINYKTIGYDPVLILAFAATFSQIGAVLAIVLKTKNKELKTNGLSAFFTGIFGITEPAIYGITLPRKKTFIYSCIGSAVGGAIMGFFKSAGYSPGGLGIFGLPNKINPATGIDWDFYGIIIAIVIAFIISFALTMMFTKQKEIDFE